MRSLKEFVDKLRREESTPLFPTVARNPKRKDDEMYAVLRCTADQAKLPRPPMGIVYTSHSSRRGSLTRVLMQEPGPVIAKLMDWKTALPELVHTEFRRLVSFDAVVRHSF